jgi:ABC-2 type transport system permease protein
MITQIWLKEIRAELYTWKSLAWLVISSSLFSITCYLLLTDSELSLLDQTELLLLLGKVIIGIAILMVTIDASSIITSEFENETAESLFLSPVSLKNLVIGKLLASLTQWALIYLVAVPYILVASSGSNLAFAFLIYSALLGTIGITSLILIVFAVSLTYRSAKNTLTTSLIIVLIFTIPALFPATASGNSIISFFKTINPIDNIFASLDNVLVDYQTSLAQNAKYLLPLFGFLIAGFLILLLSMKKFNHDGVIKTN